MINRGPQFAPAVLPPPWRGAQCSMKYELDTLTLFTVPKHLRKKEKKKHTRRVGGVQHPHGCTLVLFFHFFRCFQGLQKIKIKTSYLNKGTEVGMHDQCHRLNNLILTFLANFVKGQSRARKRRILENLFNIAMGFLRTVKKKTTQNKTKKKKHSQTAKLVYAKLLFVSSVVMRFTHEGSLRT